MEVIITLKYERETASNVEKELISQLLGLPTTTTKIKVAEKPKDEPESAKAVSEIEETVEQTETKEPEKKTDESPKVTLDEIRKICSEKAKKGRDKVIGALSEFGAKTVFELSESDYAGFKEKLEQI